MAKGKEATFEAEEDGGRIAHLENNASPDDDDVRMRYYDEDLGFSIFSSRQQYSSYSHKPRDTDYYSGTPDYVYMMDLDRLIFSVNDGAFSPLDNVTRGDDGNHWSDIIIQKRHRLPNELYDRDQVDYSSYHRNLPSKSPRISLVSLYSARARPVHLVLVGSKVDHLFRKGFLRAYREGNCT
ncbi:hypothetical protein ACEPAG_2752 [Sanghuangporus baumii]